MNCPSRFPDRTRITYQTDVFMIREAANPISFLPVSLAPAAKIKIPLKTPNTAVGSRVVNSLIPNSL